MSQRSGPKAGAGAVQSIWIGPGDRLRPLIHVLSGLGVLVRDIGDLSETATATSADDIEIVLDADEIPLEDVGYLKRFLAEGGHSRVALVGNDAGTRVVRTILALPRARWMPWPPLLDDLITMSGVDVSAPPRPAPLASSPRFVPPRTAAPDDDGAGKSDEIGEIQALLENDQRQAPRARETPTTGRIVRLTDQTEPDFGPEPRAMGTAEPAVRAEPELPDFGPTNSSGADAGETNENEASAPPPWWRAQIADLADTAQRVELGVQALRMVEPDSHEEVREHVDQLDAEVARLVQFARTLGFVASPPTRGDQVFDLGEAVQVFVSQLASRPESPPRCQFRCTEPVFVRSDRALLGQAFDAFFWLAGACAAKGDLIRVQVARDGGPAEVRVDFPSGPLERVETARILEPYGLRRILPDLGPNALAAAGAILTGQGGSVDLARAQSGRLVWRIVMPAVDAPTSKRKPK
jgi:hypothetical protein